MTQCLYCRNEIGTAAFCPNCGRQQSAPGTPAPGMPAPGYAPPGYAPPRPSGGTNGMAIASLVTAFLCTPLAIVFGHIALSQINRTGEGGRGLATAGLVLGYVFLGIGVLVLLAGL